MYGNYYFNDHDLTWYASSVAAIAKLESDPYNYSNRYQGKMLISGYRGQRMQFIQKRWFPTVTDTDTLVYIDMRYQYRPDVISVDYFNSPLYAWAIMAANGIRSIWQLEAGQFIKIPTLSEAMKGLNE